MLASMPERPSVQQPCFPGLLEQIDSAIAALGGTVVPKLNWSCPSDAAWINPTCSTACSNAQEVRGMLSQTLTILRRCSNIGWSTKSADQSTGDQSMEHVFELTAGLMPWQVLLLLKSSDRVMHDVCSAFDCCSDPPPDTPQMQLALRRHYKLRPEGELRCFVHDHRLVGMRRSVPLLQAAWLKSLCLATHHVSNPASALPAAGPHVKALRSRDTPAVGACIQHADRGS